ncbi:probable cytochrome P450 313a4 [Episyrphus balteatus]|uniref:probable cytochrome P450 313a4 n=1 Tax=Episyrphus balteatus TaxID=286459 RepID=UPI0024858E2B|nr:probable cytochrome P450 313a4 [Episyrphus balteatus]
MVVAATLIVILTFLWIYFLWSRRKYYAFALKMPGPLGFPIIGIVHKLFNLADVLYELPKYAIQNNLKSYFSWLGPYPMVYTMDPKIAEIILTSPDCIDKSCIYDAINDIVGPGILTIKAPGWNHHRKLLNPAFSHKVLLGFFPLFNRHIDEFCEKLEQNVDCGEVNVKDLVCNLSLTTSVATTMGLDFEKESSTKFLGLCERMLEMTTQRVLNPFLANDTIFRTTKLHKPFSELKDSVLGFAHSLVMKRIKAIEHNEPSENKPNHNIFIDHVIKIHQNNEYTFDDIISEGNIMVFAAFETTATTMFSTLMLLAMHPEYQEKVFDEILTIFPNKDFEVKYEDFKNLVYLEMCINETLRIFASIPMIGRNCSKDIPISKDIVIPKGTQVIVDIFNIQRDEDIWGPDAATFNPDHFLPSNLIGHHSYSFIPFSKGPRNCIGWQYARIFLRIALAQVIRKYRFTTKFKFEDIRCVEHITLRYEKLPLLEVHKR